MKLLKSMPKETAFFDKYASLVHSLTAFATIAQIITGLAEIGIIYALLYPSIVDLLPSQAKILTTTGSLFAASILQFGLKKVFPYSVRAILYKRFKGLDLSFSIAIFLLTIALLTVSILLSYKGSHDIVDFAIQAPTEKTTTSVDSTKTATEREATAIFRTDSVTIETKYSGKIEALQSEFNSRISEYERQAAKATGSIYKAELTAKAANQKAELKTKVATLQSEKATEIEAKANERKATIQRATDKNDQATALILSDNKEAKAQAENKKGRYKGYIGYFTLFCYVFFLLTYILNEIYYKGAKIDITPIPHQRHFEPSLIAEFIETIKARIDTFFRTKIYAFADKTANSPLPNALPVLYDFQPDALKNVFKIETEPQEKKTVKIPSKPLRIAAKKGNDTDTTKIVGGTENSEKPRQIGFFKEGSNDSKTGENSSTTKIVGGTENNENSDESEAKKYTIVGGTEVIGQCPVCLKSFVKNHKKHIYCTDECRIKAFENKTGKRVHKNKTGKN